MTEPSRKSSRCARRLDYAKYHETGEKVDKPGDSSDLQSEYDTADDEFGDSVQEVSEVMADQLASEEATLLEDITDFLDEHAVVDLGERIEDFDIANKRIEELRTLPECASSTQISSRRRPLQGTVRCWIHSQAHRNQRIHSGSEKSETKCDKRRGSFQEEYGRSES